MITTRRSRSSAALTSSGTYRAITLGACSKMVTPADTQRAARADASVSAPGGTIARAAPLLRAPRVLPRCCLAQRCGPTG